MSQTDLSIFVNASKRKEKVLISACLLGYACRYDGKAKEIKGLRKLLDHFVLIPICPEVSGGLKTPRFPSEIKGDTVVNSKGKDVTEFYNSGAYWAKAICMKENVRLAILKENSPSCGVHKIHNGLFDGKLIEGEGITTRKLRRSGVTVINEEEALELLKILEDENV